MNKFKIMDVTLRDGSYANHFQFSLAQQEAITVGLESCGIPYIEIGHGQGLGASSPEHGIALHSDEEYLRTAQQTLKKARYGMFCIPGIAKLEDIDMAAEYGISFLRIGTNVTEVESSKSYIERAKKHGIEVFSNYMKSQAISSKELAEQVKKSVSYGTDCVYVVDSAGCMTPNQLAQVFNDVRQVSDVPLGFHGHDNIGLVLWNCFKAVELGFEFVDCTLQGMGRSSGNASTEYFVIAAKKMGYDIDVDVKTILNLSKKYVYPMCKNNNIIDTMCGVTGMHTGYLGSIHKISGRYGVNPLLLMEEYAKYNQVYMDVEKLDEIARELPKDLEGFMIADFNGYFGHGQY